MKILDTNGVGYVLANRLVVQEVYYLVPDVKDESELTSMVHRRNLPPQVLELASTPLFDEVSYLRHYKSALNSLNIRSFFNMTGFGDISIIASIHMLLDGFKERSATQLFPDTEMIEVYSGDVKLRTKAVAIFKNEDIQFRNIESIT